MLLLDSSVWIEVLQSRIRLADLPGPPEQWAITQPVSMEVLAGARDSERVGSRLNALVLRGIDPARDYDAAAVLFRSARRTGLTVRSLNDCLIAAVAVRLGDTVVHRDADFEALRAVSDLSTLDLR